MENLDSFKEYLVILENTNIEIQKLQDFLNTKCDFNTTVSLNPKSPRILMVYVPEVKYRKVVMDTLSGYSDFKYHKKEKSGEPSIGYYTNNVMRIYVKKGDKRDDGSLGVATTLAVETKQLNDLDKKIKDLVTSAGRPINIMIGKKLYKNVVGAIKAEGTPKADFILIDDKKKHVAWISHKAGKGFSQWAGVSESKQKELFNNPLVQAFIRAVKENCRKDASGKPYFQSGDHFSYILNLQSDNNAKKLLCQAIYGKEYSASGKRGLENIDCAAQGEIEFTNMGDYYQMSASTHLLVHGDMPDGAKLNAYFVTSRSDFGIKNCRFGIYPMPWHKNAPILDVKKYM